jgi:RNA polymerase sigma-70 factor, ECF subfamily
MGDSGSDQDIVERVQRGDKQSFNLLVLKYQGRIIKLVSRFVREPADARDIAQEAFIKAYRALPGFRGDSAFYTWLYRIAINTAKNHLAALGRRPLEADIRGEDGEVLELDPAQQDHATPEHFLITEEVKSAILRVVDRLPAELRTAITLREIEGMSYEEIAQAMQCPIGTVRSRLFRAREAIDREVGPLME